jgi:hypothetical protein
LRGYEFFCATNQRNPREKSLVRGTNDGRAYALSRFRSLVTIAQQRFSANEMKLADIAQSFFDHARTLPQRDTRESEKSASISDK